MSPEEDVLTALKALAEADAAKEAPAEVEARLRFAFRQKKRRPILPWIMAAAAAIVIIAIYFRPQRSEPARAIVDPPKAIEPTVVVEPAPQPVKTVARAPRRTRPREIATEFFPLVEFAPPLDRAELVRVSLPASAMRTVGLPVREDRLSDRVQADVLVSEEGLATAIRFVKFQ